MYKDSFGEELPDCQFKDNKSKIQNLIRKVHIDAYGNVNEVKFELNGVDYLLSKMLSRIEDLEVNLSDARTEITELKATLKKPTIESKDMSTQTTLPDFCQPQLLTHWSVCDPSNVSNIDVSPNLSKDSFEMMLQGSSSSTGQGQPQIAPLAALSDDLKMIDIQRLDNRVEWTNSPLFLKK